MYIEQTATDAKEAKLHHSLITKSLNTLLGIISGLVCDGDLNDKEIAYLSTWCSEHEQLARVYPANIIYRRVHEVLMNGKISEEDRNHFSEELRNISGNDFNNTGSALPEHISSVFDDDPLVVIENNTFVLTGKFLFGTRNACEKAIMDRKGIVKQYVTNDTNFLVVGSLSSPDWITENFGRKIQKAAEMSTSGDFEISIIREVDWTMSLNK